MPNLEVYITSKRLLERTLAFAKGVIKSDPKWNVKVVPIKKFLQDGFDIDFINASVSGDTSSGGLNRAEWSLSEDEIE